MTQIKEISYTDYPSDLSPVLRTAANTIDALSARVANGDISPDEWRRRMSTIIQRTHEQAMSSGSGLSELTPQMEMVVNRQVAVQNEFLGQFLDDLLAAGEWLPTFSSRARMYGNSATAAYWHGNIIQQAGKVLPLPAYPTEGTQCLSNCKCAWRVDVVSEERNDYDAYWELGANDNCQTCVERRVQWYPVQIRDGRLQI